MLLNRSYSRDVLLLSRTRLSFTGAQWSNPCPRTVIGNLVILLQINLNYGYCYFHPCLGTIQQNNTCWKKGIAAVVCPRKWSDSSALQRDCFTFHYALVNQWSKKTKTCFSTLFQLRRSWWLQCGWCMFHLHKIGAQTAQVIKVKASHESKKGKTCKWQISPFKYESIILTLDSQFQHCLIYWNDSPF